MCETNDTTGGCCSTTLSIGRPGERAEAADVAAPGRGVTTAFGVLGMTCSHCVASVTEEVGGIAGVAGVRVDLVVGGVSTVTVESDAMLDAQAVADAVDEAGYDLAAPVS